MLADIGLLALGIVALYFGAEWLVRGAAGLARVLGVSPLVVGLTVVSYGTSAPELVVSVVAALEAKSAIVLGNVVGSNIANVGLILGVTALIAPPHVNGKEMRRELVVMLAATLAAVLALLGGVIQRWEGVLLLLGAVGFSIATLMWSRGSRGQAEGLPDEPPEQGSRLALSGLAALGLLVLVGGGKMFVSGATGLALHLGMSERVVGLTVVAVGTSLPELAASLVAALRGHSELAVGNVVGSNIFNLLLILGVAAMVHPVTGSIEALRLDLATLVLLSIVAAAMMFRQRQISRVEGALLLSIYGLFGGTLVLFG